MSRETPNTLLPSDPAMPPLPRLASPVPNPVIRKRDAQGEGHFGAARNGGKRKHQGVDLVAAAGTPVTSAVSGVVTRIGWPYRNDSHYRYVEVTMEAGLIVRHFYVSPTVKMREPVEAGKTRLGTVQDLTRRYPGITNHLHLELRQAVQDYRADGEAAHRYDAYPVIDPTPLLPMQA